jgi:hypothetical protein
MWQLFQEKQNVVLNNVMGNTYKGYKDGLQPESLADGNWLVKKNKPVSKMKLNLTQT